jgi:quinol monooxygenase YgiN
MGRSAASSPFAIRMVTPLPSTRRSRRLLGPPSIRRAATFTNTFTVELDNTERLPQALRDATDEIFRHQPGFISANPHISHDLGRVLHYAQWRSKEDYIAMSKQPEIQAHNKAGGCVGEVFRSGWL